MSWKLSEKNSDKCKLRTCGLIKFHFFIHPVSFKIRRNFYERSILFPLLSAIFGEILTYLFHTESRVSSFDTESRRHLWNFRVNAQMRVEKFWSDANRGISRSPRFIFVSRIFLIAARVGIFINFWYCERETNEIPLQWLRCNRNKYFRNWGKSFLDNVFFSQKPTNITWIIEQYAWISIIY